MKKCMFLLAIFACSVVAMAQQKVAILETVDKAGNVSYGVKLLLRSSLTSAISNTDGYEGYDRVDMASIAGEQEFQRTGAVSDNQIKEIGRAAGASYVLVAEAAKYDAASIIITAKLLDVVSFGVKRSAVLVSGTSATELEESCRVLAAKLLSVPYAGPVNRTPEPKPAAQQPPAPKAKEYVPSETVVSRTPSANEKSPWIALAWSILPGGGQIYNGQYMKAGIIIGVFLAGIILEASDIEGTVNLSLAACAYSLVDAPISANIINRRNALSFDFKGGESLGISPLVINTASYGMSPSLAAGMSLSLSL